VIRVNSKLSGNGLTWWRAAHRCRNYSLFDLMARQVNRFWVYGGGMSAQESSDDVRTKRDVNTAKQSRFWLARQA
jgi:hypothetical protein